MEKKIKPAPVDVANAYLDLKASRLNYEREQKAIKELFDRGVKISEEYMGHISRGNRIGDVSVTSHPVKLDIDGEEIFFKIEAEGYRSLGNEKAPLENFSLISYRSVSVRLSGISTFLTIKDDVHEGMQLDIPIRQKSSLFERLKITSDLFDSMEQILSENHTPRSQLAKIEPEHKNRNPLSPFLNRLRPTSKQ